jgi:hypothetical protein
VRSCFSASANPYRRDVLLACKFRSQKVLASLPGFGLSNSDEKTCFINAALQLLRCVPGLAATAKSDNAIRFLNGGNSGLSSGILLHLLPLDSYSGRISCSTVHCTPSATADGVGFAFLHVPFSPVADYDQSPWSFSRDQIQGAVETRSSRMVGRFVLLASCLPSQADARQLARAIGLLAAESDPLDFINSLLLPTHVAPSVFVGPFHPYFQNKICTQRYCALAWLLG